MISIHYVPKRVTHLPSQSPNGATSYGMALSNPHFKQLPAEARWRLCYPRRREDRWSRRRQEDQELSSAGQAGCWTHHGGAECGEGNAVLTPVLSVELDHLHTRTR